MPDLKTIQMETSRLPILMYIQSQTPSERSIVTEAIYEWLKLGYPLNKMEINFIVRILKRKRSLGD